MQFVILLLLINSNILHHFSVTRTRLFTSFSSFVHRITQELSIIEWIPATSCFKFILHICNCELFWRRLACAFPIISDDVSTLAILCFFCDVMRDRDTTIVENHVVKLARHVSWWMNMKFSLRIFDLAILIYENAKRNVQ